ncbi:tetratricopeptide repeat protein [Wenzhouxiangella limi]|uniref:Tetratricopeptide repeat protein n=1 Tax=Wenzhouxiangella limi TaxID=2707351 RepID=A0A845UXK5_9GAMM|nr:tetratricopeptide repeat protein [Wenzhouxiangella limi]NDY94590.1 tetratricopeptide repeat protein [Wenzhouxiangella limi]
MTQIKPAITGILALLLAACSVTPDAGRGDSEPNEKTPASYTEDEWSEEVLFHLRAARHAGGGDEHQEAIRRLLDTAREQRDLELVRQAAGMAWRTRHWPGLIEATDVWLAQEPGSADARRLGILARLNADQSEEAISRMQDWLAEDPDNAARLLQRDLVQIIAAAESTDQAPRLLDALIEAAGFDPEGVPALVARSRLHWETGDAEQALVLARRAADLSGERDELAWAAQLASALEDHESALMLYRRAYAVAPDEWTLGLAEAQALRNLGRLPEALDVLSGLPDNPDVLYSRASYLFEADQKEAARDVWQQLAAWAPVEDGDQHAFMVGWLAEFLALEEEAADWYARVRSGPQADRAMIRRAVLLAADDRLPEARELLKLARDTEQRDQRERAYLVEVELLGEHDQHAQALELLSDALRETPDSVGLLYARAMIAVNTDNLDLAEQDLRRIIRIDGDNAMALNALGYTLTDRTSRHSEAYRLIRRALELAPEEPAILDSMGWVYFRLGEPESALPYLERAFAGDDNPEIAAHLAEVLWHLDQTERAGEMLREARIRHPDNSDLKEVMQRLEITL